MKHLRKSSRKNQKISLAVLSVMLLSGCGDSSLPPLFGGSTKARPASQTVNDAAEAVSQAQIPTVRGPQNFNNNKNLFGKSLKTDDERLNRLERSVQSLRNDFDTVQPSIRRLMSIESDIQELIGELKQLSDEPTMASGNSFQPNIPVAPAPVYREPYIAPAKKVRSAPSSYMKKSAPAYNGGNATIFDVRTGEHPGKTRIVLDSNAKTSYSVDIDNNENIMVVDLPSANWGASTSKSFPKSSIISSYSVENSGSGSLLVLQLKRNARVTYQKSLPSNSGAGQRIVMDVAGL